MSFTSDLGKRVPSGESLNAASCHSASSSAGVRELSQKFVPASASTANSAWKGRGEGGGREGTETGVVWDIMGH